MVLLARLLSQGFGELVTNGSRSWSAWRCSRSRVGAFGGLVQSNVKRLWAYSSIATIGYAIVGLAAGGVVGVQSMLVYMVLYIVDVTGFFACLSGLTRDGRPLETMDDFAGLMRERPATAMCMTLFALSALGLPPLGEFWGKFYVFRAALGAGTGIGIVAGVRPGRQRRGGLLLPQAGQDDVARSVRRSDRHAGDRSRGRSPIRWPWSPFRWFSFALGTLDPLDPRRRVAPDSALEAWTTFRSSRSTSSTSTNAEAQAARRRRRTRARCGSSRPCAKPPVGDAAVGTGKPARETLPRPISSPPNSRRPRSRNYSFIAALAVADLAATYVAGVAGQREMAERRAHRRPQDRGHPDRVRARGRTAAPGWRSASASTCCARPRIRSFPPRRSARIFRRPRPSPSKRSTALPRPSIAGTPLGEARGFAVIVDAWTKRALRLGRTLHSALAGRDDRRDRRGARPRWRAEAACRARPGPPDHRRRRVLRRAPDAVGDRTGQHQYPLRHP